MKKNRHYQSFTFQGTLRKWKPIVKDNTYMLDVVQGPKDTRFQGGA